MKIHPTFDWKWLTPGTRVEVMLDSGMTPATILSRYEPYSVYTVKYDNGNVGSVKWFICKALAITIGQAPCHICRETHWVVPDLHGKPFLKQDSIHMPGWHTWSDGLVRRMDWVSAHRFTVGATATSVEAIPQEPETEMDIYFRENPNANKD